MEFCRNFNDLLQSLWRRFLDWRMCFLACLLFAADCILTYTTWTLGASLWFMILYTILGIIVWLIAGITKNPQEMSPLLPPSQVNENQQGTQSIEKFKVRTGEFVNAVKTQKINSDALSSSPVHEDIFTMDSLETDSEVDNSSKNPITCVEITYTPRIAYDRLVTGPSPGGGYSRKLNEDTQSRSWQKRLSPLLGPFKEIPPTEASAQFHVSLSEPSFSPEDATNSSLSPPPVSETQSVRGVQVEDQATGHSMAQFSQQPIYETIIPPEELEQTFSHSEMLKFFQYDTPKSLRRFDKKNNVPYENVSLSAPGNQGAHTEERNGRNRGRARLGPFTSFEKTYVNVSPSLEQKHERTNRKGCSSSDPTKGLLTVKETYSEPSHDHSSMTKRCFTDKDKILESTPTSRLYGENLYMNVHSLRRETMGKTDRSDMDLQTPASVSIKNENIYMNVPEVLGQVVPSSIQTESDIQEQVKSEHEYSKSDHSGSDEINDERQKNSPFQDWIHKKDTNRARSEYMYVTGIGQSKTSSESTNVASSSSTQTTEISSPSRDDLIIKMESSSPPEKIKNMRFEELKEYFKTFEIDDINYTDEYLEGITLGEHLSSVAKRGEQIRVTPETDGETTKYSSIDQGLKAEYENPIYGENLNTSDFVSREIDEREESSRKVSKDKQNLAKKNSLSVEKPLVFKKHEAHSQTNPLTEGTSFNETFLVQSQAHSQSNPQTEGTSLNETFLVQSQSCSSFSNPIGKSRKLDTICEATDNQTTSSNKESLNSSKDEDSICQSKNSSICQIDDSLTKYLVKPTSFSERCNIIKHNNSPLFSNNSIACSVLQHETAITGSKGTENLSAPKEQLRSKSSGSRNDEVSKWVSFNTPLTAPKVIASQKSEFKNDKSPSKLKRSPRIFPPLDRTCSSSAMQDSSQASSLSPKQLDRPAIRNQSSVVQTQIQKFSFLNEETSPNSAQSVRPLLKSPTKSSVQSSTTSPLSKSQTESAKRDLDLIPALRSPKH